jgi:hypothetical protein
VIGGDWTVSREIVRDFWVGCVLSFEHCVLILVNVYIPPSTSPHAPQAY